MLLAIGHHTVCGLGRGVRAGSFLRVPKQPTGAGETPRLRSYTAPQGKRGPRQEAGFHLLLSLGLLGCFPVHDEHAALVLLASFAVRSFVFSQYRCLLLYLLFSPHFSLFHLSCFG